jgi:hypothetical protein
MVGVEGGEMTQFTPEYLAKVRVCAHLIEPPAAEVIGELIDEIERLREQTQGTCKWTLVDDDSSHWAGECGAEWIFVDSSPEENDVVYCMKCGKRLEQLQPDPEGEE